MSALVADDVAAFGCAIEQAGLVVPEYIEADGRLHRFSSSGRRGDRAGWYVLHDGECVAGAFGCWRTGVQQTWCSQRREWLSGAEWAQLKRRQRQAVQAAKQQRQRLQDGAAQRAQRLFNAASTDTAAHPYLRRKGVRGHGIRVGADTMLYVPVRDIAGVLHSVQCIDASGGKWFLAGGRTGGGFHLLGQADRQVVVCEGYATAASIHEATGLAVAAAFNAGNLRTVAKAFHQHGYAVAVAADDDHSKAVNVGLDKAQAAALSVGGTLVKPVFLGTRRDGDTDFNDLYSSEGAQAVAQLFTHAGVLP